jgi:outer membrane protein assembly factor BamB
MLATAAAAAAVALFPAADGRAATGSVAYQGDAAHSGRVSVPGLRPPLRRRWARAFPNAISYPVVAEGKVYVAAVSGPPLQLMSATIYALHARSGRIAWQRSLGRESGPAHLAYAAGRIFVAGDSPPDDTIGRITALRASDGAQLWQVAATAHYGLVAQGDAVYLPGPRALRATDGAMLWGITSDDASFYTPALADGRLFSSGACRHSRAFDPAGTLLWESERFCTSGGSGAIPAVHAGRVYVPSPEPTLPTVFEAASGRPLGGIDSHPGPAFSGTVGVFPLRRPSDSTRGETLVARRLPGGRRLWRFAGDGYLDTPPLIVGATVYVGSGSGRLYGLSLRSGRVVWRGRAGGPIPAPLYRTEVSALGAGEGVLVVPAFRRLVVYSRR